MSTSEMNKIYPYYAYSVTYKSRSYENTIRTDLSTASDRKLFERPDVIDQQIHKSKFITKSNQDVQSRGVKGNTVTFLLELFILF